MSRSRARADRTDSFPPPSSYDGACARCELDYEDALESAYAYELRSAGLEYAVAFTRWLEPGCAIGDPLALEARSAAMILGPKVARLSAFLAADGSYGFEPVVADDAQATLALIQKLDGVCERATLGVALTDQRHAKAMRLARKALLELLAPLESAP